MSIIVLLVALALGWPLCFWMGYGCGSRDERKARLKRDARGRFVKE